MSKHLLRLAQTKHRNGRGLGAGISGRALYRFCMRLWERSPVTRLSGPGFRFRFGISLRGCACLEHRHPMLQIGPWRFVLWYPACVRKRVA